MTNTFHGCNNTNFGHEKLWTINSNDKYNMAALPPNFTVHDAVILCGVDDNIGWNNQTQAERIADEVFNSDFRAVMEKTMEELEADLKSYSTLTAANGKITLNPSIKRNIRAFMQWCRDEIRMGRNPSHQQFQVEAAATLVGRMKAHDQYVKESSTMLDAARS